MQVPHWKVDVTVNGDIVNTFYEAATTAKAAIAKAKRKMRGAVSNAGAFKFAAKKVDAGHASHATMRGSADLDARVRAYLSHMRSGTEVDARGVARALHEDALGVTYALERAVRDGVTVTEDNKWFGPAGSSVGHARVLGSVDRTAVLVERVTLPNNNTGAIHIHHGKGGYSGVLVTTGGELPMSLGSPKPETATEALRGAKKFLAQVYGKTN